MKTLLLGLVLFIDGVATEPITVEALVSPTENCEVVSDTMAENIQNIVASELNIENSLVAVAYQVVHCD